MGEWKEYKLGEVSKFLNGRAYKATEFREVGMPIVRIQNLTGIGNQVYSDLKLSEDKYIDKGDLVYAWSATFGPFIWKGQKSIYHYHIWKILCNEELINKYFLYYHLLNKTDGLKDSGNGTLFTHITKELMESFVIKLPSISEQLSITRILRSLDNKIDLLHRQNKTLEQLAETLFRQWFVENQTTFGKLGNLVEATFGGEWGKEVQESDYNFPVYCIRGTDIADLQVGLANRTPLRYVKEKKYKSIEMRNGDLVMEISGGSDGQSTGRTILINEDVKSLFSYPLVFSNFCRLIRPINPESGLYLLCYINMLYDQGDFFNLENGSSGIRNFDYKALLFELDYEIHDSSQILNFNKAVKPYFEKINKNKFQIRTLTQLRDTLLPKLMSGEVRVI